ncbi:hypothetical protein IIA79_08700 [bacterium]|nr:hypothetical protein [bacterium]
MQLVRIACFITLLMSAAVVASCGGGGGNGGGGQVSIASINLNPAAVTAGAVVELSATINAPGQNVSSLLKSWNVTAGTLMLSPPEFSLFLRQIAKGVSASSVSTANGTVYWVTPTTGGPATISLTVENTTKSSEVQVGVSPVTLSVSNGPEGSKICTVEAQSISDLYQAAFRVNFTSAWQPASVEPGSFLGGAGEILFLGLTNQNGFVPCAITRKGAAAGVNGSGVLATITFTPAQATSATREVESIPFELGLVILRNSKDEPISVH